MYMNNLHFTPDKKVLILGGTGFVGRRLILALYKEGVKLRVLVRNPYKIASFLSGMPEVEIQQGDLLKNEGIKKALRGIHTAYYLVHSMGGKTIVGNTEFARKDKMAAQNFLSVAESEDLKRIIYLGGLGEAQDRLSEHLKSRAEIAHILSAGAVAATILRAAVIIGAGGASFEILRYLVERLPIMISPRWIDTKIQPIAVKDVIAYLAGCLFSTETAGKTFDIGGPEILTYRRMMDEYTEARGIAKRVIITIPVLTPHLSAYWVDLVTPVPSGIAHPLIEGLRNEVICRDNRID
jgi:uncharacterized protein YbjT (DUF2867 family)